MLRSTGDSADYLALAPYRPPVYGWVVIAFRWVTGGLGYLPALQFVLLIVTLLGFAIELGWIWEVR